MFLLWDREPVEILEDRDQVPVFLGQQTIVEQKYNSMLYIRRAMLYMAQVVCYTAATLHVTARFGGS